MIVFHEGLPRSGKSYEAVVRRLIPALLAGRRVFTNIAGVDHERIADAAPLPVEKVRELLHVLTDAQLLQLWTLDLKNSLLVLDEVQNTWGVKAKLPPEMVKFVAEHGHHGIDVILMSQDYKDVHVIWRRRIEVRQVTMKLTGIGKQDSYSVTTYRGKGQELYEKVSTKVVKYDPRYFGTYKSYSDSDVSTAVLKDDRATVWGSGLFRYVIPSALFVAVWGGIELWGYFHPDAPVESPPSDKPRPVAVVAPPVAVGAAPSAPTAPSRVSDTAVRDRLAFDIAPARSMLGDLSAEHRIRLAAVLVSGGRVDGVVEWVADGGRVIHRLTFRQLRDLGVTVEPRGDAGAILRSGSGAWLATTWPTDDPRERSSVQQVAAVSLASTGGAPTPPLVAKSAPTAPQGVSDPVSSGRPSTDTAADLQMIRETTKRTPFTYVR